MTTLNPVRVGLTGKQLDLEIRRTRRAVRRLVQTILLPAHATAQDMATIMAGLQQEIEVPRRMFEVLATPSTKTAKAALRRQWKRRQAA